MDNMHGVAQSSRNSFRLDPLGTRLVWLVLLGTMLVWFGLLGTMLVWFGPLGTMLVWFGTKMVKDVNGMV